VWRIGKDTDEKGTINIQLGKAQITIHQNADVECFVDK
jgi:hypothetical protein